MNRLYTILIWSCLSLMGMASTPKEHWRYVDPRIGSVGVGRVFVGPSAPFGMVKPGPDCTCKPNSGWLPMPEVVTGFSQVHVSGTGGGPKYGNILVQPFSGELSGLQHESIRNSEKIELGYYSTIYNNGIQTEITTASCASFYRFGYPAGTSRNLLVDAGFFLGEEKEPDTREAQQFVGSEIEVVSNREIRGYGRIRGGWNNGKAYTVFFYAIADAPFEQFATWKGAQLYRMIKSQCDEGKKTGVLLAFGSSDKASTVHFKVGISFISSLKAKQNVEQELPQWDFDGRLTALRGEWEQLLSRIDLGARVNDTYRRMFYTGMYHTFLMPVNRSGENPLWTDSLPYYDDFYAIWDIYRTSLPLLTLVDPNRERDIVNALINIYKRDGYMPDARSGNSNGRTQGGSNAEIVIADAYAKGLTGIDYELALQAMMKDATMPPGGNEEQEGRGGLVQYNKLGYVPFGIDRAGNRTVEYAFDDYCIAMVAKGLGKDDIYNRYIKQAGNWQNLWRSDYEYDGVKGFVMPRSSAGEWLDNVPFGNSKVVHPTFRYTPVTREAPWYTAWWSTFFYEATSWEYSLSIPHDVPMLIEKCGGKDAFLNRLNQFFDKNYYNVNNEPSFLTPCLYHWIGRPDLTGSRVRQIIETNYNDTPSGLPGNDDSGAMSSWLAFHLMGFYPNAGMSYYLLHAPLIEEYTLTLAGNKKLHVIARGLSKKNCYVQQVLLNGKQLDRAWIEHTELLQGGELMMKMGDKPTGWGSKQLPSVIK